jgi:non-specific serine/threonine protein kinase
MGGLAVERHLSNLPAEATSFVGRRQELREVKRLLTTTRLLTLTGSGGVGKTKLALRAAAEMSRGFPDGTWLVLLGSIRDPMLVTQATFTALGLQDRSAGWSLSTLAEHLAGRRLLLVVDNCEHLLDGCAVLAGTLISASPGVHVLATSRQALGVAGEVRMVVPPMSLPSADAEMTVEQALSSEAVWLLSERAAAVDPGFAVNADNATQVVRLCQRLDGIPLALELAAVRLGSLSLEQLNRGLADELSALGPGNRGAEARQQTLEATIGWSYGLLDERERLLWARLSVFAGGFEEDAATQVCGDPRLPPGQIAGLLGALVDKSVLKRQLRDGVPPRYWLLETMRQYGRERRRELDQGAVSLQRHFDWMCALAMQAGAWDDRQVESFRRISEEQDNVWAALDSCARQPGEVAPAAEAAEHLMAYWASRGPFGDVRRVLTGLADLAPENSIARGRLLWVAAIMALNQNDIDACRALSGESLRIGTEVKDVGVAAWSLLVGAIPRWLDGDLAGATEQIDSALSLARLMRIDQVELNALNALCSILVARGDLDRAVAAGEQGLAMSKDRGELWMRGYLLTYLAQATWRQGHRPRAETLAREAATCNAAIDDRNGLTNVLETLAWMAAECGRHGRAATLLGCAEQVRGQSAMPLMDLNRPQHDRSVTAIVHAIGEKAFAAAFARGRAMTIGEGVAFAAEDKHPPRPTAPIKAAPETELTPRQLEIARLVADDLTNRQIAARLYLSERTVETHVTNILNRLGLNSRVQLTRWLAEQPEVAHSPRQT